MRPEAVRILGGRVDRITHEAALDFIRERARTLRPSQIVTTNTLMLLAAESDAELREILENAALSIPESSGLFWAGHLIGKPFPAIFPGIDLMLAICAQAKGQALYLLGSAPGVAEAAAAELRKRFPNLIIAGTHHGYIREADEAKLLKTLRAAAPTFLFVGMGMPAQEKWIAKNLQALGVPIVMGVGGSFDVLSGRLARAPDGLRTLGLEWVFRLYQEPWRWRRIAQLPIFLWKVVQGRKHVLVS